MKSWNSIEPTHNTGNNKCSVLIIYVIMSENENENENIYGRLHLELE